jgi:hypothetical protein
MKHSFIINGKHVFFLKHTVTRMPSPANDGRNCVKRNICHLGKLSLLLRHYLATFQLRNVETCLVYIPVPQGIISKQREVMKIWYTVGFYAASENTRK